MYKHCQTVQCIHGVGLCLIVWGIYQTHNIVLYNTGSLATYMYIYMYNISHPEQLQHLLTIIDPAMPNYGVLVVSTNCSRIFDFCSYPLTTIVSSKTK